ncbi:MAG: DUF1524 domain-containing protein [Paracoccaceae bacterium]|nr:DUF1524 domain-containing protein [Paracoccaceae bacterium]
MVFRFLAFLVPLILLFSPVDAQEYSREMFMRSGWQQHDRMNTRHRILMERSLIPPELRDSNGTIKVIQGEWIDALTGRIIGPANPDGVVEIDHVIPLKWAWDHGASVWSYEKRNRFANDRRFLIVTSRKSNNRKRAKGADIFIPADHALACTYLSTFSQAALEYVLDIDYKTWTWIATNEKDACRGNS